MTYNKQTKKCLKQTKWTGLSNIIIKPRNVLNKLNSFSFACGCQINQENAGQSLKKLIPYNK